MSQEKLAEIAQLDANNISRIERGEVAPESLTLIKLIYALGIYQQSDFLTELAEVLKNDDTLP